MRSLCDFYKLGGKALPVPDGEVVLRKTDLEAPESGRDESGWLHRSVLRQGLGRWEFSWSRVTGEEYAYLAGLLTAPVLQLTEDGTQLDVFCREFSARRQREGLYGSVRLILEQC